ncbi:ankyrin repeat domain-containing protein [Pontivivens ytuae]|uniref:Ankyrin repeat domain-containing protein n=1 Tax=Pontivivens ytuae TaxID=2789856 RepID=A0A7S9LQK3_9RHOB|nr:ankyrin repeat domain-containing protein [Pontivivens ytuae]QPH53474.1 ankyrin repeat domain-containing protein [Pontivivens ytuae]
MARKKKTLPKDFEEILARGDLDELKAVFKDREIDAVGGTSKQTALAFGTCPDAFTRWLVGEGADLGSRDARGRTPLHTRAGSRAADIAVLIELGADVHAFDQKDSTPLHVAAGAQFADHAAVLLAHGAALDARNRNGLTPLELALQFASNATLPRTVAVTRVLLEAGAEPTERARGFVTKIGETFEFHRANFNPETVEEHSAALDALYRLFDVPPVPRRVLHDGVSTITVTSENWPDQHEELWQMLVPGSGPARTVQGEVIRISGRVADEIDRNGGINWDADYDRMVKTFLHLLATGQALPTPELDEARKAARTLRTGSDSTRRFGELAVRWVLLNPAPAPLPPPDYAR